ncbi:MAG: hypothetical protein WDW36_007493 [Sanguina aurantia]
MALMNMKPSVSLTAQRSSCPRHQPFSSPSIRTIAPTASLKPTSASSSTSHASSCSPCASSSSTSSIARVAASGMLAAGLSVVLALSPASAQAASFTRLSDVLRPQFEFVDADKNGFISKAELLRTSEKVADEESFEVPTDSQLEETLRLFDLNSDGRLALDELLVAVALDGAVSEDAVDSDVVGVFDQDRDGLVSMSEFNSTLGDFGPSGEGMKEFVFRRVDTLAAGGGRNSPDQLDPTELGRSLQMIRTLVLGF